MAGPHRLQRGSPIRPGRAPARRRRGPPPWVFLPLFLLAASCPGSTPEATGFAERIAALSGPAGYFDTDNLISNERSYLHAISDLREAGVRGGLYLGVGPDQNFSYIAEIEPELAIIVDIRADNVLQHLMYKAMFHAARNRVEFLALLTGRPVPGEVETWLDASLDDVLDYVDGQTPTEVSRAHARQVVDETIRSFGHPIPSGDSATIARFHGEFIDAGLDLRFRSHGRAPQFYYPTYRELLEEVDREGRPASYVATEERFQRVRELQLANRIVPIVGDLGGEVALARVGEHARSLGLEVSALYTSNVEFYLFADRTFLPFVRNLEALPLARRSVIIKSYFRGFQAGHPRQVPGYYSTQIVQDAPAFVRGWRDGTLVSYWDAVTAYMIEAPAPAARSEPEAAPEPEAVPGR